MKQITEQQTIQEVMQGVLAYLKTVCEKHHLHYYLAYGTLIGAIRHKGFIPWDDDIDLWMLREDYQKLIEILKEHPDERYRLVSFPSHKGYHRPYIKIIDSKTYVVEHTDFDVEYGLWVDIFPLDDGGKDREESYNNLQMLQEKCGRVVSVFMPLKNCSLKRKIGRILWRIIFSLRGKERSLENYLKAYYKGKESDSAYLINPYGIDKERDVFKKEWFSDSTKAQFGGDTYSIPIGYHEILTQIYGDYMKLPPEKDRVHHLLEAYWK